MGKTRRKFKKSLAVLLVAVLALSSMWCFTAFAAEVNESEAVASLALADGTGETKYYDTVSNAVSAAASGTEYVVTMLKDSTENITVSSGYNITLDLAGNTLTGTSTVITNRGTLVLTDSTATTDSDGNYSSGKITGGSASTGSGVYNNGGTFTMEGGTITGNTASNYGGGVYSNGGTFTMKGGAISNNTNTTTGNYGGAGVYIAGSSGVFNMEGGTISENTSPKYGGGVFLTAATFNMSGGTISGNSNTSGTYGGGVYIAGSSIFNMSGGTITGNSAGTLGGGVYVTSATFNMTGGTISENTAITNGGGVYVVSSGTFNMSGGVITGNKASASSSYGGGVYSTGSLIVSGGTISKNEASSGGGVYSVGSTFNMTGGTITGNNASGTYGGGVYNGKTLNMTGGKIYSNTAEMAGADIFAKYASSNTMAILDASVMMGNSTSAWHYDELNNRYSITNITSVYNDSSIVGASTPGTFSNDVAIIVAYATDTVTIEKKWQDINGNDLTGAATAACPSVSVGLFMVTNAGGNISQNGGNYYYISSSGETYQIGEDFYARDDNENIVAYYNYSQGNASLYVLVNVLDTFATVFQNPVTLFYDSSDENYGWVYTWDMLDSGYSYVVLELTESEAFDAGTPALTDTSETNGCTYYTWQVENKLTEEISATENPVNIYVYDGTEIESPESAPLAGAGFILSKVELVEGEEITYYAYCTQDADGCWGIAGWIAADGEYAEYATIFTSDESGYINTELEPGTYSLTETEAPAGYLLPADSIEFTVDVSGTVTSDSVEIFEDGITIPVANVGGSEMPLTGGTGTIMYTMVGLLLVVCAVYLLYKRKRAKGGIKQRE